MLIFNNTTGGHYDYNNYGKMVSYTFPEKAYVNLNGVIINISGLKVDAFGGKFDFESNRFFTQTVSLLPPKSFTQYNTNLLICDSEVSGDGFPGREDFKKYNIDFLSGEEFISLQREVNSNRSHPKAPLLIKTIQFFKKWTADKQEDIKSQLQVIMSKNSHYPKHLSIIYDDRKLMHTTHIVLSYESPNNCTLRIDNTLSPIYTFSPPHMTEELEQLGISLTTCKESISKTNPKFIELFKSPEDEESAVQVELSGPVNSLMLETAYDRMIKILTKQLQIPITQVNINYPPYNQKNIYECVVFAIQNKIDFIENNSSKFEPALETGTRLRAEQAVLAYLLQKTSQIPHADEQASKDCNLNYPMNEWYPNYSEVCCFLDKAISNLEFSDLSKLFLATELDDELSLSPSFKKILLHQMSLKAKPEDYVEIPSWLSIGDEGAAALAENKTLRKLNLRRNLITAKRNMLEREKLDVLERKNYRLECFNQDFKEVINILPKKMRQFQEHPDYKVNVKLQEAYNAASTLFQALEQEGNQFINKDPNLKDYEQFKLNCKEHIKNARTILDEHRGWTKILLNIFAMIMTGGIGYAVAAAINVAVKGRFTFFSTDSSEKLSNIEKHIETKEALGKQGYLK